MKRILLIFMFSLGLGMAAHSALGVVRVEWERSTDLKVWERVPPSELISSPNGELVMADGPAFDHRPGLLLALSPGLRLRHAGVCFPGSHLGHRSLFPPQHGLGRLKSRIAFRLERLVLDQRTLLLTLL